MAEEPSAQTAESTDPQSSGSFVDKAKQFLTMGGDKKKWTKALIISAVVIILMGLANTAAWGVALAFYIKSIGEPNGNSSYTTADCYMPDQFWKDPSSDLTVDIIKQRVESYKNVSNAENDARLQKLLTYTREQGYNPAVALAVWGKESTYTSNVRRGQDFGFSVGGGFDKQLPLAVASFDKAFKGEDPYPKKAGTPIQVNWLEIYTPSSDPANVNDKKTFFKILTQAEPTQVICNNTGGPATIMRGNVIVIDPGHASGGNKFAGSISIDETNNEGDNNWMMANKVKKNLESSGFSVLLTKSSAAEDPAPSQRAQFANSKGATLFVSLHSNDKGGVGPMGLVYCADADTTAPADASCAATANAKHGADVSHAILNNITSSLGLTNPRFRGARYGALTGLAMPGTIIEMFAHDQSSDIQKVNGKSDVLAKAISDGILQFVKKN